MANRTLKDAHTVKGTNPQYLVEKIIRSRIYESKYWKEECFALSAELLVDKAMELKCIGGIFGGNIKPTPFLCLILKMLQIQPDKDIVVEFISQQNFKYVRALGAMYMRLTGTALDCYKYLEPLYLDYRKMRKMNTGGNMELTHMDEFIDDLLREERVCDIILPRIQKRQVLEESNQLDPRMSALDENIEDAEEEEEEEEKEDSKPSNETRGGGRDHDRAPARRSPSPARRRSRSRSPRQRRRDDRDHDSRRNRDREDRDRERDRDREDRDRDRDRDRRRDDRGRDRPRSRERDHDRDRDKGRTHGSSRHHGSDSYDDRHRRR